MGRKIRTGALLILVLAMIYTPVSYTHLDVYKRQVVMGLGAFLKKHYVQEEQSEE